jgi:hypothetical protein
VAVSRANARAKANAASKGSGEAKASAARARVSQVNRIQVSKPARTRGKPAKEIKDRTANKVSRANGVKGVAAEAKAKAAPANARL